MLMILIVPLTFSSKPKPSKKAKATKTAAETATAEPAADPYEVIPPENDPAAQFDDSTPMDHDDIVAPEDTNVENVIEPASPV